MDFEVNFGGIHALWMIRTMNRPTESWPKPVPIASFQTNRDQWRVLTAAPHNVKHVEKICSRVYIGM